MNFLKRHKIEILVGLLTSFIFQMILILWNKGATFGVSFLVDAYYYTLASMSTFDMVANMFSAFAGVLIGVFAGAFVFLIKLWFHIKNRKKKPATTPEMFRRNEQIFIGLSIAGCVLCVLLFLTFLIYIILPAGVYGRFQKDCTMIRPYITEYESEEIQSKWVQIQNREDYKEVCDWIKNIKEENNLG